MRAERFYDVLPVALQNGLVSMKGWQFHRARYLSSSFKEATVALERNERLSIESLKEMQFEEFRSFAEHCYRTSPYYRSLWQSRKLRPNDIRQPDDIRLVPIVPKQDLRAYTEDFFTTKTRRGMTAVHTSGTTGSPLTVYFSSEDLGRRCAFLERCRRWAGVRIGQRRATFSGRNICDLQRRLPFWRYNYPGKQLLFSSYHLSAQNLPAYVDAMEEYQPEIIDGYPSAIHIIAEHILRNGRSGAIRPHAILVSAETVLPHQRQAIERAFNSKLYNQYASSEGAPFISECKNGRLHVQLDSGLIEILDSEGSPVAPGKIGQMVVTSFTTHVVPLLRFAIGDSAVPSSEKLCECGLTFPIIDALVGRVDDMLYTAERGFVGRLDTVFKSVPNSIIEAQIVQISAEMIVLRVVPERPRYRTEHADEIVREMRKRLGNGVVIRVEEVHEIPRSANGKMRSVVNLSSSLLPTALQYSDEDVFQPQAAGVI